MSNDHNEQDNQNENARKQNESDEAKYPPSPVEAVEQSQGALAADDNGVVRPVRHITGHFDGVTRDRETLEPVPSVTSANENNPESRLDPSVEQKLLAMGGGAK